MEQKEKEKNLSTERQIAAFFSTVQHRRSQHARTLIPMNTCTQTLPL